MDGNENRCRALCDEPDVLCQLRLALTPESLVTHNNYGLTVH